MSILAYNPLQDASLKDYFQKPSVHKTMLKTGMPMPLVSFGIKCFDQREELIVLNELSNDPSVTNTSSKHSSETAKAPPLAGVELAPIRTPPRTVPTERAAQIGADGRPATREAYRSTMARAKSEQRLQRSFGKERVFQTREFELGRQLELQRQLDAVRKVELYRRVKGVEATGTRQLQEMEPGSLEKSLSKGFALPDPLAHSNNSIDASKASHVRRYLHDYQRFQSLHQLAPETLETYRRHLERQLGEMAEFRRTLPSISPEGSLGGRWRSLDLSAAPIAASAEAYFERRKKLMRAYTNPSPAPKPPQRWSHQGRPAQLPSIDSSGGSLSSSAKSAQLRRERMKKDRVVTSGALHRRPKNSPCMCFIEFIGPSLMPGGKAPTMVEVRQQRSASHMATVFKEELSPGAIVSFLSHRPSGVGFHLALVEDGDGTAKVNACCEAGVKVRSRLGGKQGAFRWLGVKSALPCLTCQLDLDAPLPYTNYKPPKTAKKDSKPPSGLPAISSQQRRNRRFVSKPRSGQASAQPPDPAPAKTKKKKVVKKKPPKTTSLEEAGSSDGSFRRYTSEESGAESEELTPTPPDPQPSTSTGKRGGPPKRTELSSSEDEDEDSSEEEESEASEREDHEGRPKEWDLPPPSPWMKEHIKNVRKDMGERESEAAMRIQRSFRGFHAKKEARKHREAERRGQNKAATKIQRYYRSKRRDPLDKGAEDDEFTAEKKERAKRVATAKARRSSARGRASADERASAKDRASTELGRESEQSLSHSLQRSESQGGTPSGKLSADFEKRLRRASSALLALEEKFDAGLKELDEQSHQRSESRTPGTSHVVQAQVEAEDSSQGSTKYEGVTWTCSFCDAPNPNVDVRCSQCPRGTRPVQQNPRSEVDSDEEEADKDAASQPASPLDAIWSCAACNFENSPSHAECRICQHPKGAPAPSSSETEVEDGDEEESSEGATESGGEASEEIEAAEGRSDGDHLAPPEIAVQPASPDSSRRRPKTAVVKKRLQFQEPVTSVWDTASRGPAEEEEAAEEEDEEDTISDAGSSSSQRLPRPIRKACRESEEVSLTGLDLSDPDLAAEVGVSLGRNKKLRSLYLRGSDLPDASLDAILSGLHDDQSLKVLNLNTNHLTDASVPVLVERVRRHKVEILMVRENSLTDAGVTELLNGLTLMGEDCKVRRLDLGELGLGVNSALALKDLLGSAEGLESLLLGGCRGLSTQDWVAVSEGLQRNSSLQQLKADDCEMGDKGLAYLCKGLQGRPNLRLLDLDGNSVTEKGAAYLYEVVRSCPKLEQVVLLAGNRVPADRLNAIKALLRAKTAEGPDRLSISSAHFPR